MKTTNIGDKEYLGIRKSMTNKNFKILANLWLIRRGVDGTGAGQVGVPKIY